MFVSVPDNIHVLKGEPTNMSCRVKGLPIPKVKWYKNGKLLRKDKHLSQQVEENTELNEVISEVSLTEVTHAFDEGHYKIEAINDAGTVEHEFDLEGKTNSYTTHYSCVST